MTYFTSLHLDHSAKDLLGGDLVVFIFLGTAKAFQLAYIYLVKRLTIYIL